MRGVRAAATQKIAPTHAVPLALARCNRQSEFATGLPNKRIAHRISIEISAPQLHSGVDTTSQPCTPAPSSLPPVASGSTFLLDSPVQMRIGCGISGRIRWVQSPRGTARSGLRLLVVIDACSRPQAIQKPQTSPFAKSAPRNALEVFSHRFIADRANARQSYNRH